MKKIEKVFKIIKKGEYWPILAMLFMCMFPVALGLLGFSSTVIAIAIAVSLSILIVIILRKSFKNANGVKYTYDTSNAKKLNEYEKIYMEFYKKYTIL